MSIATGARQGELRALRWQNVDLEKGEIRSEHMLNDHVKGGGWLIEATKTEKSERPLSLDGDTVEALKLWKIHQDLKRGGAPPLAGA